MEVVSSRAALRRTLTPVWRSGAALGFVPTMGALHAGHRSLLHRARADTDTAGGLVVASIFVNPLQFGPGEDLATYPRDLDGDLAACEEAGVDVVLTPTTAELWPRPPVVRLSAGRLGEVLEGAHRPGHLDGVATVVATLFHLVFGGGSGRAYFGQKDAQQLALIRRMVADLSFAVEVVGCPIVREPDGLALSSRNAYLDPAQRAAAPALHAALTAAQDAFAGGERRPDALERAVAARLAATPQFTPDYAVVVDPDTFERVAEQPGASAATGQVVAVAARIGRTRLIDNLILTEVLPEGRTGTRDHHPTDTPAGPTDSPTGPAAPSGAPTGPSGAPAGSTGTSTGPSDTPAGPTDSPTGTSTGPTGRTGTSVGTADVGQGGD